jgi:alanyl-tRNA synthetase
MTSSEIRQRFLDFFEKRGHAILPSASLVPENDPSVLFNTAGMQPLVPYLMGQPHPLGNRLASCQKCVRTGDLDDIGDNRHFSFFEMLGNWSLGDYFKEDAIKWSYEFLTNPIEGEEGEKGLGLDVSRLYVTVFVGDENAPEDIESQEIWQSLGIPKNRIYKLGAEDNWWSPGDNGPCGPCTEMFYDMTGNVGDLTHDEFIEATKKETVIEIWNDVFMEYEKKDGKVIGKLKQKNVDTGAGLERLTAVMQEKQTAYETDLFEEVMSLLNNLTQESDVHSKRIIADHIRTAIFMISDGVVFSANTRGYVLRKLARRAAHEAIKVNIPHQSIEDVIEIFASKYKNNYPEVLNNKDRTVSLINDELSKFGQVLSKKNKFFNYLTKKGYYPSTVRDVHDLKPLTAPNQSVGGLDVFLFEQEEGVPLELLRQWLVELDFSESGSFEQQYGDAKLQHQEKSRTASAGMFKGGLANHNEKTIRLHTAHHLLLAALQTIVDPNIKQRGSNITEERLRIDFSFDRKVTPEELQKVEDLVNEKIKAGLPVVRKEMAREEAEKLGAQMEFGARYPDMVSVYMIGGESSDAFSKEFCGGPHVGNTKEIGEFKIQKEEASSAGVRRIKAVVQ